MDIYSKEKRSQLMSSVKSSGNKSTELRLISIFREHGLRGWRRNYKLIGSPDFVFVKERLAVFVDGCFWHGCKHHYSIPKSNAEFWQGKIAQNVKRDQFVTRVLRERGWRVSRIWEHDVRSNPVGVVRRLNRLLKRNAKKGKSSSAIINQTVSENTCEGVKVTNISDFK